jgi:hypothetical protein
VRIRLRIIPGVTPPSEVELRVSNRRVPAQLAGAELEFELERLLDHEVAVITWPS